MHSSQTPSIWLTESTNVQMKGMAQPSCAKERGKVNGREKPWPNKYSEATFDAV